MHGINSQYIVWHSSHPYCPLAGLLVCRVVFPSTNGLTSSASIRGLFHVVLAYTITWRSGRHGCHFKISLFYDFTPANQSFRLFRQTVTKQRTIGTQKSCRQLPARPQVTQEGEEFFFLKGWKAYARKRKGKAIAYRYGTKGSFQSSSKASKAEGSKWWFIMLPMPRAFRFFVVLFFKLRTAALSFLLISPLYCGNPLEQTVATLFRFLFYHTSNKILILFYHFPVRRWDKRRRRGRGMHFVKCLKIDRMTNDLFEKYLWQQDTLALYNALTNCAYNAVLERFRSVQGLLTRRTAANQ